jgi:hypothetical protein
MLQEKLDEHGQGKWEGKQKGKSGNPCNVFHGGSSWESLRPLIPIFVMLLYCRNSMLMLLLAACFPVPRA